MTLTMELNKSESIDGMIFSIDS